MKKDKHKKIIDTHKRSIVKSISWRIIATLTTIILVFIFTKSFIISFGVGFFEITLKIIIYYYHERAWNKITWGKNE
ncbi:DUF2061 domain-containing protein [Candidatus Pacearchaeota archaeon]|nr:DUF2061 domain-containing protein [Candidatus Pacearchaeota archaeon]